MKTIKWIIDALRVNKNDNENIVVVAIWKCQATSETDCVEYYGNTTFPSPTGKIVEYKDITEEIALKWIFENGTNKSEVEEKTLEMLKEQEEKTEINKKLPWVKEDQQAHDALLGIPTE